MVFLQTQAQTPWAPETLKYPTVALFLHTCTTLQSCLTMLVMQEEESKKKKFKKYSKPTDVRHRVEEQAAQGYLHWWTHSEEAGRMGDKLKVWRHCPWIPSSDSQSIGTFSVKGLRCLESIFVQRQHNENASLTVSSDYCTSAGSWPQPVTGFTMRHVQDRGQARESSRVAGATYKWKRPCSPFVDPLC